MPIFLNLFQKIAEEHFQTHSTKPPSLWYQKQIKTTHKKRKLQANITDEHRSKNPQKNFSKQNSVAHQKAHIPRSRWDYSRNARFFNICTSINVICHINKLKDKNHLISSIDAEEPLTKFSTHLWLKLFKKWA